MAIQIENLNKSDKGRWVNYKPSYPHTKLEKGRIKSWNDTYIFVVYKCDEDWDNFVNYAGCATPPEYLSFT